MSSIIKINTHNNKEIMLVLKYLLFLPCFSFCLYFASPSCGYYWHHITAPKVQRLLDSSSSCQLRPPCEINKRNLPIYVQALLTMQRDDSGDRLKLFNGPQPFRATLPVMYVFKGNNRMNRNSQS